MRRRRWRKDATYEFGVEARRALDRGRGAHRTRVPLRSTGGVAPLGGPDVTSCASRVLALSTACLPTVSAVRIGAPVSSRPRYAVSPRLARARWPLPRVLATRSTCVVGAYNPARARNISLPQAKRTSADALPIIRRGPARRCASPGQEPRRRGRQPQP